MGDQELKEAQDAILSLLSKMAHDGHGPLSAPELVTELTGLGLGEEAERLAMWYLIDRHSIELTPNWRVQHRADLIAAP